MSAHFQPDEALTAELKRRCQELTGSDFVDVRWHPQENCLAIFERHRAEPPDAPGVVRTLLVDEKNEPRQLNRGDVEEVVNAIYGRRKYIDEWKDRWEAAQEERKRKAAEDRHEIAREVAKEMVRVYNYGTRPFVAFGAADVAASRSVSSAGLETGGGIQLIDPNTGEPVRKD